MNKNELKNNLNKIKDLYIKSDISIRELSNKFNISTNCISRFLKLNNVVIKTPKFKYPKLQYAIKELNNHSLEEVSKKYGISEYVLLLAKSGMNNSEMKSNIINMAIEEYKNTALYDRSINKIALKYGINRKTLKKYLTKRNVEIIANGGRTHFNFDFFETIDTEEKAYWLGFLYADGYVGSKDFSVGLNISLKDIEHLRKFNDALNYKKGLNISETHQFNSTSNKNKNGEIMYMVSTVIRNKKLWTDLNNKGCVPNKSLILQFPNEKIFKTKKLIYDFIRGYVDGDGTLGVYRHSKSNNKLEESLLIVGTKDFLVGVQKYLGTGFLMHKANCNNNTYRLGYSTKKAHKAADLLYKNASIYLNRKYNIYINKFAALKLGKIGELCDENTEIN